MKTIKDNAIYTTEVIGQLQGLYYLVSLKRYSKDENIWKTASTFIDLWKIINTFYNDHPKKPIATFLPIVSTPPIAKPLAKLVK